MLNLPKLLYGNVLKTVSNEQLLEKIKEEEMHPNTCPSKISKINCDNFLGDDLLINK